MTQTIITTWKENMAFESENPGGKFIIDASPEDGGEGSGFRPKALMLSALAGCSGLDVASMMKKMRLAVDDFVITVSAELTEEHPRYYNSVLVDYHFTGESLDKAKLQKAIDLSVEKYCGVMEMFRRFAEVTVTVRFN
ncbi:MAG: osmotically inducible protein OsmC [Flavobacteriales bacterium CG_4_9_14_3_um_filter_40_17]|nr:MAG: osmotically inducible protein OsmC [Flavobacteriales bacterium CG_4_9_14_3_um_filter_40_17]